MNDAPGSRLIPDQYGHPLVAGGATAGVYMIWNKTTGKVYIGKSKNIRLRWNQHRRELRRGDHANAHLRSAWLKYGAEDFVFRVLDEVPVEEALLMGQREHYWANAFQATDKSQGYNLDIVTPEATHKASEETLQKMRVANTGKVMSAESRLKMSASAKGHKMPDHVKAMVVARSTGRRHTQAELEKMRAAQMGVPQPREAVEKTASAHRGRKRSSATCSRIREALIGRPLTEAAKENLSQACKGREITQEAREKMSLTRKGKTPTRLSDEDRQEVGRRVVAGERRAALAQEFNIRPNYVSMLGERFKKSMSLGAVQVAGSPT